jgi:predicted alpha/beta-hydrolase family hydrolase
LLRILVSTGLTPAALSLTRMSSGPPISGRGRSTNCRTAGPPVSRISIASLVALERPVAALVCLGYPFHPPGRPEQTRVEHLRDIQVPTLICQGTRDPFGLPEEVAGYGLSPAIRLVWIDDGEHSLKPGRSSGRTWEQNLSRAAEAVAEFASVIPQAPTGAGGIPAS